LEKLDLAALIVSRVCHDLISPVGALSNGVEVLAEETDPEMRNHAIALIQKSALQAAAKLKLCRLAYGSMGSAGESVSLTEARDALEGFLRDSKTKFEWDAPQVVMPKDIVKLCVNLGLAALDAIPRGGVLKLTAREGEEGVTLEATAGGQMMRLTEDLKSALDGDGTLGVLDGRRVQAFMTGMIARELGASVETEIAETGISLRARIARAA
jgi:histidine phosphotransferase ChpT